VGHHSLRAVLAILLCALVLASPTVPAQARPKLADYFTEIPETQLDPSYSSVGGFGIQTGYLDFNADGQQDLLVLGYDTPASGLPFTGQLRPGRLFVGDGNGHFTPAPASLFPISTLQTMGCGSHFGDFNGDGRPDMFVACGGWDVFQGPGEQNHLYLTTPEGTWRDATDTLPQLSDRTESGAAIGDVSGRGILDIFVGNGVQGANGIPPYMLLNTGSGQFTRSNAGLPTGNNQILDPYSGHNFSTATLADLDGDGRADLIAGGGSLKPRATILWNRAGLFAATDTTLLPKPASFPNTSTDSAIASIDVNQDGLPDLVSVGRQLTFHGWYLQILVNHGNHTFVDETADRVQPADASRGTEGVDTASVIPKGGGLQILDFNQDGAPDISVGFQPDLVATLTPDQPLVWLNDSAGHFSTLTVGDFVAAGKGTVLGTGRLVATRNGYSFINVSFNGKVGRPLTVTGMLATKPYRLRVYPQCFLGAGCSGPL